MIWSAIWIAWVKVALFDAAGLVLMTLVATVEDGDIVGVSEYTERLQTDRTSRFFGGRCPSRYVTDVVRYCMMQNFDTFKIRLILNTGSSGVI